MKLSKNRNEFLDIIIPVIGLLFIVVSFINVFTCYELLQDKIPIHYGLDGMPDNYDNKSSIWSLPILSLLLFIGLNYVSKIKIQSNFAAKSVVKNADYLKNIQFRFIQILNSIIAFIFFYITYKTIQIGLENDTGLGSYFIYLVFVGLISPTVIYTILFYRKAF